MEIVPIEEDFVIEARLSPADIGFVHLDQDATVKVDAFDYTIYGSLEGKVVYISADTLDEKNARAEEPYYRLQVLTKDASFPAVKITICKFYPG